MQASHVRAVFVHDLGGISGNSSNTESCPANGATVADGMLLASAVAATVARSLERK